MFIWTISDLIGCAFVSLILVVLSVKQASEWIKQRRCNHESVRETMACDAICNKCGKNLGFIGSWRKKST